MMINVVQPSVKRHANSLCEFCGRVIALGERIFWLIDTWEWAEHKLAHLACQQCGRQFK